MAKNYFSLFFLYALPLFFVLNGWVINWNFIRFTEILILLLYYLSATLILHLFFFLIYRNTKKAALASFYSMAIFFFFGYIHDQLKSVTLFPTVSKYSILLPVTGIVSLFIFFIIFKRKEFTRLFKFLNTLLVVLLLVELLRLAFDITANNQQQNAESGTNIPPDRDYPDIYLIVPDEYSRSSALKELWNYSNDAMDSFLVGKGFFIPGRSQSNYNFTPFSMASTLNMDYLYWIKDPSACTVADYNQCALQIKNNRVIQILDQAGYEIVNHSVFDLKGLPSQVNEPFLPLKTKLITQQTLFSRIKKDLGHLLYAGKFEMKWLTGDLIFNSLNINNKFLRLTDSIARTGSRNPRFIYTHLYMPHPPFYFDRMQQIKDKGLLMDEAKNIPWQSYLEYLPYTNNTLQNLVSSILENNQRKCVILILSDHGFRNLPEEQIKQYSFQNFAAVYLPDRNYVDWHDSITNVNIFPKIFNNLFHTEFRLKNDSLIFLKDKKTKQ